MKISERFGRSQGLRQPPLSGREGHHWGSQAESRGGLGREPPTPRLAPHESSRGQEAWEPVRSTWATLEEAQLSQSTLQVPGKALSQKTPRKGWKAREPLEDCTKFRSTWHNSADSAGRGVAPGAEAACSWGGWACRAAGRAPGQGLQERPRLI